MGGFRKTYGDERGELLSSGLGGETQYVPVSVSPLHSPGFWDAIHDEEPTGRRLRMRPEGIRVFPKRAPAIPQRIVEPVVMEWDELVRKRA